MEEEPVSVSPCGVWESTPFDLISGEKALLLISAQMFEHGNELFMFGGFPKQEAESGKKEYLEELRSVVVDAAGRPVSAWKVVQTRGAKNPSARIAYAATVHRDKLFVHGCVKTGFFPSSLLI